MARLTAERLRQIITVRIWGETRDDAAVLEHAARVVEAAEPAVSRRYCRRGHAKADECLAELRLFLYKLDAALEGTDGE